VLGENQAERGVTAGRKYLGGGEKELETDEADWQARYGGMRASSFAQRKTGWGEGLGGAPGVIG